MKRVLQINAGIGEFGGVEKILFDIYKNIDKKKIQFDFISPYKTTYELYKNEIINMGANVFELNADRRSFKGKIQYNIRLYKFLKKNKYEIVHINSGVFLFNFQVACICKICGVKRIIIHSHNAITGISRIKRLIINALKPLLARIATDYLACSDLAAKAMFPNNILPKVKIIKNGIDLEKFKFNKNIREEYRNKMELKDKIVYGHIGRFEEQKNHEFLIDIFYYIQKRQKNAVLLLVGQGSLHEKIKNKVNEMGINKQIMFLNTRKDISELLQTMDCFIFPSLYEGLSVVGIEVQTSGIPMFCSDSITDEMKILNTTKYISLKEDSTFWGKTIIDEMSKSREKNSRLNSYKLVKENGYDIKDTAQVITKIYLN